MTGALYRTVPLNNPGMLCRDLEMANFNGSSFSSFTRMALDIDIAFNK